MKTQLSNWVRLVVFSLVLGWIGSLPAQAQGAAGDAAGTWKWSRTTQDGQTMESTLELKIVDGKVTGKLISPFGEAAIEDAKVAGGDVSFTITRDFNGQKMVMKYQGKLAGDALKGTIAVDRDGQTTSRDWEAKREKTAAAAPVAAPAPAAKPAADPAGTWKWSFTPAGGDPIESTLSVKVVDGRLTGTLTGRSGQTAIEEAKMAGDVFSFTVTRERNGQKFVMKYQGTLAGDTLKGTTAMDRDGQTTSRDWEAKREKAVAAAPPAKPAVDPTGAWKWSRTNASGQTVESTLQIKLADGKLSGTLIGTRGATAIAEARIANDELTFSITRDMNGTSMTQKYAGKISGDELTGTIQSGSGDQARSRDWAAKREKTVAAAPAAPVAPAPGADPSGTWKMTLSIPNADPMESTMILKVEAGRITGTQTGPNGDMPIPEARMSGDQLTFTLTPEFNGQKLSIKHQAKLEGDTLKGNVTFDMQGQPVSWEWSGKREKAAVVQPAPVPVAAPAAKPAADPAGLWKWNLNTPNGDPIESTLNLKVEGGKITGTLGGPFGEMPVGEAKLAGDQLSFTLTPEFNSQKFTIKYQGAISGDTLKGKISVDRGEGEPMSFDWDAKREKAAAPAATTPAAPVAAKDVDPSGSWKWFRTTPDGQKMESTMALKLVAGKLTGTVNGPLGEATVEDCRVAGDEVTFQVTRDFNGEKFIIKYRGKLAGDTLKGTTSFDRAGQTTSQDWEANREKTAAASTVKAAPAPVAAAQAVPSPAPATQIKPAPQAVAQAVPAPAPAVKPAADPSGSWKWVISTPDEQQLVSNLNLTVVDGKLTGTCQGPLGEARLEAAKVVGDEISFRLTEVYNGEQVVLKSTGKQEGDSLRGTLAIERQGQNSYLDWEARREAATAPVAVAHAAPAPAPVVATRPAVNPTGTWKWIVTTPDEQKIEASLALKLADGKLSGVFNGPLGAANLEEAQVVGDEVSFCITREINGEKIVLRTRGKQDGDLLKGSLLIDRDGQSTFLDWIAMRESSAVPVVVASASAATSDAARPGIDPTGAWKWAFVPPNGEPIMFTLNFKMEHGKLTGKMVGPNGETAIEDARVVGDEISFSITRDFNGEKFVSRYGGKLSGNEIQGMIAWAAKRTQ